jgi:hypothetical protein
VLESKTNATSVLGLDGDEVVEWIASKEKDAAAKERQREVSDQPGLPTRIMRRMMMLRTRMMMKTRRITMPVFFSKARRAKERIERLIAEDDHLAVQISPRLGTVATLDRYGWRFTRWYFGQELLRGMRDIVFEFQEMRLTGDGMELWFCSYASCPMKRPQGLPCAVGLPHVERS